MYIELCWPKEDYLYFPEDIKLLENKKQLSSKALKYFSLFLIQVEIVMDGTPYFLEASLLDRLLSISCALHF